MCIFLGVSVGLVDVEYTVGENSGMVEVCLDLSGPIAIRIDVTLSVVEDTAQCKEENSLGHIHFYLFMCILCPCPISYLPVPSFIYFPAVGSDYSLQQPGMQSYPIAFLPGEMLSMCQTILILEDSHLEESEQFFLTLDTTNPVADLDPSMSTVTILDNDGGRC